jgi:hypothetical protein
LLLTATIQPKTNLPPHPQPILDLSSLASRNNQLLLLLQPLCNTKRNLQRLRDNSRRRESQPLRQRDIDHAVGFVDFDPLESLVGGRVFDVVSGVVGEYGCVAGAEVEGAGCGL